MTATREGLQEGAAQWALVNKVPRAAKRSRFGVWTPLRPPMQLTQSFRSSTAMNNTLGGCSFALRQKNAQASRAGIRVFFIGWEVRVLRVLDSTKKAETSFRKEKKAAR